jgi:hypothetical protein
MSIIGTLPQQVMSSLELLKSKECQTFLKKIMESVCRKKSVVAGFEWKWDFLEKLSQVKRWKSQFLMDTS